LVERPVFLQAKELHSVQVAKTGYAVWGIIEGKEDENYESVAYSLKNLEEFDFSELYKPVTQEEIKHYLNLALSLK
jgi:hypothetical protein